MAGRQNSSRSRTTASVHDAVPLRSTTTLVVLLLPSLQPADLRSSGPVRSRATASWVSPNDFVCLVGKEEWDSERGHSKNMAIVVTLFILDNHKQKD
jgi:hypothetical protein